jgi:hypothetical protein
MAENVRDSTLTIGTTSVMLVLQHIPGERVALAITNTSTGGQSLSMAWGKLAIAGQGVVLYPGGSWSESIDNRFTPSEKEIQVVSTAAGGTAAIHVRTLGTGL